MRRNQLQLFNWYRYKFPIQPPQMDGPPPADAPANMNATKEVPYIDPVENNFPRTIRGAMTRPDVPDDQYVTNWYICSESSVVRDDLKPWSAYAPHNAYRFRPFNEFDKRGREMVSKFRSHLKWEENRKAGTPYRESFLTKMNGQKTPPATLSTKLDRALKEVRLAPVETPLQVNRDVGRIETPHPLANSIVPNREAFPFSWNTEDWYEYEVTAERQKRFQLSNQDGSEVTYRIVLESFWDHHAMRCADDVASFVGSVGKQIVEEKLASVQAAIRACSSGGMDRDIVHAFTNNRQPFHSNDAHYDDEEVKQFALRELRELESQCNHILNLCNVDGPKSDDTNISWPVVKKLEPWVRMAEFWASSADKTFREVERSTKHYEFRRYYRVIEAKLPFQSTEFEKRMYDIRHWLHRSTSAEFHTVYKKNIVHDILEYPVEHDATVKATPEHHQLLSFALDWNSAPMDYTAQVPKREGDTWSTLSARYGCSVKDLQEANNTSELLDLSAVQLPRNATKRPSLNGKYVLPLSFNNKQLKSWADVAEVAQCEIEDVQELNPAVLAANQDAFDDSVAALVVPYFDGVEVFAKKETVFSSDTMESLASRLGTTVEELVKVNGNIQNLDSVTEIVVPATAATPRRVHDPALAAGAENVFANTIGEAHEMGVGEIPLSPANAHKFPHEFHKRGQNYPAPAEELPAANNWLEYTARYLDTDLSATKTPSASFQENPVWPELQVPGKKDQTPFVEDQTWFMRHTPLQQTELSHPDGHLQDLPLVNNEQFPRSMEWQAP